ncbi:MAG TPA: cyclase family protein [Gemmatimonadaceae bacterium]
MRRLALPLLGIAVSTAGGQTVDLARVRMIDLTHPFNAQTIYWPNAPSTFKLERLSYGKSEGGWFYSAFAYSSPEHGGTHLDAPIHFSEKGRTADQIPLAQLVAPAVVLDISAKARTNHDYRLTVADVQQFEKTNGAIKAGTIVLLRTDWSKRWPNRKAYMGDDTPGDATKLHFPSYGVDAAKLLINERKVAAIGVDVASIDYGASKDFMVHQIAGAANVPGFENLMSLDQLPATGATVIALPMKIEGGSGGPLRAVALVPR